MSEELVLMRDQRTLAKFREEKGTLTAIFRHVANGGSLIDLCETWDILYSDVTRWIYEDAERKAQYENALQAQTEWAVQRILKEIRDLGFADPREAFDDEGNLKDIKDMPKAVAATIQGVTVKEYHDKKTGELTSVTKNVKFWDKLRAIELLGKNLKMFSERIEHSGKITLEALIASSMKAEDKGDKKPSGLLGAGDKVPVTVEAAAECVDDETENL